MSARAAWALGRLGETAHMRALRERLPAATGEFRHTIVAVLSFLGDRSARHALRAGFTARAAPTRRAWVRDFAWTVPDPLDQDLLSRNGDGIWPFVDARAIIDRTRVERMVRLLRRKPAEIERRYTILAKKVPLQLRI